MDISFDYYGWCVFSIEMVVTLAVGSALKRSSGLGAMMMDILFGVLVGIIATLTMDVLGGVSQKIGITAGVEARWVGRWYIGIAQGKFRHAHIEDYPQQNGEMRATIIGHYLIGMALAVFYLLVAGWIGLSPDSFTVAMVYGFATCVFPWFLMFPALGFGWIGLNGPKERHLIRTSIINHLYYGFGLWWISMLLPLG